MRPDELDLRSGAASLRVKLAIFSAAAAILVGIIASIVVGELGRRELFAAQEAEMKRDIDLMSADIQRSLVEILQRSNFFAQERVFTREPLNHIEISDALIAYKRRNAFVLRASFVNSLGIVKDSTDPNFVETALEPPGSRPRVRPRGDTDLPGTVLHVISPVPDGRGAIITDIRADWLRDQLSTVSMTSTGAIAKITVGGNSYDSGGDPWSPEINTLDANARTANWFFQTAPVRWNEPDIEGAWDLAIARPTADIVRRATDRQLRTAFVGLVLGALVGLLMALMSNRITRRLDEIGKLAFQLRTNRYAPVTAPSGHDEIARLGRIVSGLVTELNQEIVKKESAENSLLAANYELEQKVADRTRELESRQKREMEIAGEMQSALLIVSPPNPNSTRLSVDFRAIAARQINGDFIAWFNYNRDQFDIVLGDAMGKGLTAAVAAAGLRLQFERAIRFLGSDSTGPKLPMVAEIVAAVESQIAKDLIETSSFATLAFLRVDLRRMKAEVLNTGHPAIVRMRQGEPPTMFECRHMPIGFVEHQRYESLEFDIAPGDRLVVLSDGVLEAAAPSGELFGWDRLIAALKECDTLDPAAAIDSILETTRSFGAEGSLDDASVAMIEIPSGDTGIVEIWEEPFELDFAGAAPDEINKLPVVARVTLAPIVTKILSHEGIRVHEGRIRVQLGRIAGQLAMRIAYFGEPIPKLDGIDADYGEDVLGRNMVTVWLPG